MLHYRAEDKSYFLRQNLTCWYDFLILHENQNLFGIPNKENWDWSFYHELLSYVWGNDNCNWTLGHKWHKICLVWYCYFSQYLPPSFSLKIHEIFCEFSIWFGMKVWLRICLRPRPQRINCLKLKPWIHTRFRI